MSNPQKRKRCTGCNHDWSVYFFHKDRRSKDGYSSRCRYCRNAQKRANLPKTYDITIEQWDALYAGNRGRCAICRELPKKRLEVDHDHTTKAVRGLLCGPCNRALGLFKDNPETLMRAAEYLGSGET